VFADSKDSGTASSEDGERPHHRLDLMSRPPRPDTGTGSDWSDARPDSAPDSPEYLYEKSQHPAHMLHHPSVKLPPGSPPSDGVAKPRIWSLADMASKENDHHPHHHIPHHHPASAFYSAAGKLVPSAAMAAAARLAQPPPHHPMYARPPGPPHPDFYRLYSSAAHAHLHGGDVSLLESYTRQFALNGAAANGAPLSMLSKAAVVAAAGSAAAAGFLNGTAAGLTPIPPHSSASSSSSSMEHQLHTAGLLTKVNGSPPPPHTALPSDKSPPSSNGGAPTAAKA